jgi:hypothetical protein
MTPAEFKAEFPEFNAAPDALVQAKLDDAVQLTDGAIWGALYWQGVKYAAAELLARSPFGRSMQLADNSGNTAYSADLQRLRRLVAQGFRVSRG